MTEPEGFLSRWARLKQEAAEPRDAAASEKAPDDAVPHESKNEASEPAAASDADARAAPVPPVAAPSAVDLSALPAIESITATTDIRAFLAPGVPAELTRAALRRAWAVDPNIRDFIGIAENQWDFTAENAITGFGPLGPLDDVRRMVAELMGEKPAETPETTEAARPTSFIAPTPDAATAGPPSGRDEAPSSPTPAVDVQCSKRDVAMHIDESGQSAVPAPSKRGHGGALPE